MKALALFSGGLDSMVAIKLIQEQGIEVIAINFVSYFFGGKNEKAEFAAEQLGVKLEYIDFKEAHKKMLLNPPSGYGKNMNPCIDCHALMFRIAGDLLEKYEASFIITGEVLGQRPMSQNANALRRVVNLSNYKGLIVRPLSGRILDITKPEIDGWIDRGKLDDINGRGRKRQMALAESYGLKEYPSPGGGCLLTEPNYSRRLKILKEDEQFENSYFFELIKYGRFFRLDKAKYIIVGREKEANYKISEYKEYGTVHIIGGKTPGPAILGCGKFNEEEVLFMKELYARYSKSKGKSVTSMLFNGKLEDLGEVNLEPLEEKIKKYMIV